MLKYKKYCKIKGLGKNRNTWADILYTRRMLQNPTLLFAAGGHINVAGSGETPYEAAPSGGVKKQAGI